MKTLTKTFLATSLCLLTAVPAYAHYDKHGGIWDRLERQQSRIEQGIDSGELTRKEAKRLKKQQRKVRWLFREFRDDGHLSKHERRKLNQKLDRISSNIWEFKHNHKTRYRKSYDRYHYDWHDGDGWSGHRHSHD
jgi:hypothetical protein